MRRTLLILSLAAGLAAGCSHPAGPGVATAGAPPASGVPATDADTRLHQYASCLRDHGLHVDDPAPGQAGVRLDPQDPPDKAAAAVQACLRFAEGGTAPTPPSAAELAGLRRYAQCMRDHKVTSFPDPDPQTGFFSGLTKANYDTNDPTVKAALAACQSLAPTVQPGG